MSRQCASSMQTLHILKKYLFYSKVTLFSYKGTAAGLAQGGWAGSHPKLAPYYRRIRQLVRFGSPWKIPLHLHPSFSQTRDIPQFTTCPLGSLWEVTLP